MATVHLSGVTPGPRSTPVTVSYGCGTTWTTTNRRLIDVVRRAAMRKQRKEQP